MTDASLPTDRESTKSCPFCGGVDTACFIIDEVKNRWWVECDCGAKGPPEESRDDARATWNVRATRDLRLPPEPRDELHRKLEARNLHYTLIEAYGLKNDPASNHAVRQDLERLAGLSGEPSGNVAQMRAALEHCYKVFVSMANRGAYPQELLPYELGENRKSPLFMGIQGIGFIQDAIKSSGEPGALLAATQAVYVREHLHRDKLLESANDLEQHYGLHGPENTGFRNRMDNLRVAIKWKPETKGGDDPCGTNQWGGDWCYEHGCEEHKRGSPACESAASKERK